MATLRTALVLALVALVAFSAVDAAPKKVPVTRKAVVMTAGMGVNKLNAFLVTTKLTSFFYQLKNSSVNDYLKENFAKGVRKFTILAPTDTAYKLYKPNTACRIPARTQTSQLFLPEMYTAVAIRRLRNGQHLPTLTSVPLTVANADQMTFAIVDGTGKVLSQAKVVRANAYSTPFYVVHTIDRVLAYPC